MNKFCLSTVVLACAAALAGCSNSPRLSPTGPTPTGAAMPQAAALADGWWTGAAHHAGDPWAADRGGVKARGEGTVGSITGSCPTLTLVITGTRVQTTATTEFVNGTCDDLRPGTKVRIDGELFPGGEATAERIEILRTPGRPVSGDGPVGEVTGTCPDLTLKVRGVTVITSSTTTFTGGTCESIVPGTHIDVTGDFDGTTVTATTVNIRQRGRPVSGDGPVATVTGSCPSLTLVVRGVTVLTTAATTFTGGTCESIVPGTHLDVTGDYDGTAVTATAVAIRARGGRP